MELYRPWDTYEYVSVDTESTGSSKKAESLIEIGLVNISKGKIDTTSYFTHRYKNTCPINKYAYKCHGISEQDLENEPLFVEHKNYIEDRLNNKIFVAHNVSADIRILRNELGYFNPKYCVDTLRLSRKLFSYEKTHKLKDVVRRFRLEDTLQAQVGNFSYHSALSDSVAAAECFIQMLNLLPSYTTLAQILSI